MTDETTNETSETLSEATIEAARKHIDELLEKAYQMRYSDTARAFGMAQEALQLSKENAYLAGELHSLRQMAGYYMVRGQPAKGLPDAMKALALATETDSPSEITHAYITVGTLHGMVGNVSLAAESLLEGLEWAKKCDDMTLLVLLHHNLAGVYYHLGDFDRQIAHSEQVLRFAEQADEPEHRRVFALTSLGTAYIGKGDYERAISYLTEVLEQAKVLQSWYLQASTLRYLGVAYIEQEKYAQAEETLRAGLELATAHNSIQWVISTEATLADLYTAQGDLEQGLTHLLTGLAHAQQHEHLSQQETIHHKLAQIYELLGDHQLALDHHRQFHELYAQEHDKETQIRIQVLTMKYDLDEARRNAELNRIRNEALQNEIKERERTEAARLEQERLRIKLKEERKLATLKEEIMIRLAHEFRTPLTGIKNSVTMLTRYHDRLTSEKRDKHEQFINNYIARLVAMLDDIIAVLRSDADATLLTSQRVDLVELCQTALQDTGLASFDTSRVQLHVEADRIEMITNQAMLLQVIEQLLSNALKFSSDIVDVHTRFEDGSLAIAVSDHGIGIPPSEHSDVFLPFFRASNLDEVRGNGLGLTIVQNNIMRLGGRVELNSVLDQGTTVTVYLPLLQEGDNSSSN